MIDVESAPLESPSPEPRSGWYDPDSATFETVDDRPRAGRADRAALAGGDGPTIVVIRDREPVPA
ncbi:MAG: hypothetical protein ACJ767_03760 [Chloroflexota bacterium]